MLIDTKKVHWKNLRKFVEELAKNETMYLLEEMKSREKMGKNISRKHFKIL